ncbi:fimbrillin family protein [Bacteroides uniformis]|uniref:fimbrillin family protein n=1 Tax=Bacteroides uniformis TaxID=820 RepID=UPI003517B10E
MNGNVKLLGMVATASIMLASCSNDELKEVYKGEKISFTTQIKTRATETTTQNLKGFYVYADADNFEDMFINGRLAKKEEGESGKFTITDENGSNYLWPSGVKEVRFWAYGPDNLNKDTFKPTINTHTQQFDVTLESSMENGGTNQQDFIVAYQSAQQGDIYGGTINLTFYHALSQICINAKCPDYNNRKVDIKGAWLVNINQKGNLSFSESAKDTYNMQWTPSLPSNFGVKLENLTSLTSANTTLIGQAEGTTGDKSSSLMLIPQKQDKWKKDENPKGAYILFLCRIEAIHKGTVHSGEDSDGAIHVEGDYHYHQLFPAPQSNKWNRNEYGYTCVGVDIDWKPNHKYVYNVIFCGQGSGAGVYPPTDLPENLPDIDGVEIVETPEDKVGDTVLDSPLSFEVTVGPWQQGTTGNGDSNTNMD